MEKTYEDSFILGRQKQIVRETIEKRNKEIIEWIEKVSEDDIKIYGTDKYGISKDDLIKFINK